MWNSRMLIMAAGLALAGASVPQSVDALQAGRARAEGSERARAERARTERARTERARAERDRQERERYERGRYEREGRATARRNQGNGPPFCRDGRGHPVHGRRWCTEHGYRLGNDRYDPRDRRDDRYDPWDRRDDRLDRDWERVRWDVAFYNPRYRQSRLSRNELTDLLGRRSYDRFDEHRRRSGFSGSLLGNWTVTQRGYGLQLLAGGRPLALLVDGNRDGRVDEIYLARRR